MKTLAIFVIFAYSCLAQDDAVIVAEKQYNATIDQAKKEFVAKLKVEQVRLMKAGELDEAVKLRDKIAVVEGSQEKRDDPSKGNELIGKWTTDVHGPWIISEKDGELSLREQGHEYHSVASLKIEEGFIFKWSSEDHLFIAVTKSSKGVSVSAYRVQTTIDKSIIKKAPLWSYLASKDDK